MVSSASPSPGPAQPSFSVNWFALRLYTFMVLLVVAVAARHRRSYRNDETGHGPGHQGDYDGSGQQSCKCNYVDFSK